MSTSLNLRASSLSGPGVDYLPVTPSNTAEFSDVAVALYAETAGAISFISQKGEIRTVNVPDFGWVLCRVKAVRATGTTAGGIHAVLVN